MLALRTGQKMVPQGKQKLGLLQNYIQNGINWLNLIEILSIDIQLSMRYGVFYLNKHVGLLSGLGFVALRTGQNMVPRQVMTNK